MNNIKTVLLATCKKREKVVTQAIDSIYQQVDEIRIVFNGYKTLPQWVSKYHKKVKPLLKKKDEMAANAVWELLPVPEGWIFVIDDDIIYPIDYVLKMINFLKSINQPIIATVHGTGYYPTMLHHFKFSSVKQKVEIAGVGTVVFHSETLNIKKEDFIYKYLRDVQFSILAAKQRIPIYCIPRELGWLVPVPITENDTICDIVQKDQYWKELKTTLIHDQLFPLLEGQ